MSTFPIGLINKEYRGYWRGLVSAALLGGNNQMEFLSRERGILMGNGSWQGRTNSGTAFESSSTSTDGVYFKFSNRLLSITGDYTIFWYGEVDTLASYSMFVSFPYHAGTWATPFHSMGMFRYDVTDNTRINYASGSSTQRYFTSSASELANVEGAGLFTLAGRRSGINAAIFKDGKLVDSGVFQANAAIDWGDKADYSLMNKSRYDVGEGTDGRTMAFMVWNRALTDEEIAHLQKDPFGPFRPIPSSDWPPTTKTNQSAYIEGASNTIEISGNEGHIVYNAVSGDSVWAFLNAVDTTDVETTLKFRFDNNTVGAGLRFFIRASRDWNSIDTPTSGYEVLIEPDGDYTLNHIASGSRNLLGSGTWTGDTAQHSIRFQAIGTAVKFKVWASASAEPGTWDNEHTAIASEGAGTLQLVTSYISGSDAYNIYIDDVSYHTPSYWVTDNQPAYVAGSATSSDNQPAYVAGSATSSDNQPAYVEGIDTQFDNQPAYIAGQDTASDNQAAYVQGQDTASDNQPAYLEGSVDVSDNQLAYIQGQDTASDNQSAYVSGGVDVSDNQAAYVEGGAIASASNISAFVQGQDTTSDNQIAYIQGQDTTSDNQPAYVSGGVNVSDNQIAYVQGQDTTSDNQAAYVQGQDTTSDNQAAYVQGQDTTSDNQPAYLEGSINVTDNQPAYLAGVATTSSSQSVFMAVTTFFPFTEDFSTGSDGDSWRISHWLTGTG